MRLRSVIRGVYTVLAVMVDFALLSGRDDATRGKSGDWPVHLHTKP
ncbi:hypothetical protein Hgul01_05025 [Herpetosiphon gulosus]|uniref:Uncharacterized protein n=1 Tax=Herpetosiphon gulosus TaxID=1973496 RepID=A0ABP9X737_9CHLR